MPLLPLPLPPGVVMETKAPCRRLPWQILSGLVACLCVVALGILYSGANPLWAEGSFGNWTSHQKLSDEKVSVVDFTAALAKEEGEEVEENSRALLVCPQEGQTSIAMRTTLSKNSSTLPFCFKQQGNPMNGLKVSSKFHFSQFKS